MRTAFGPRRPWTPGIVSLLVILAIATTATGQNDTPTNPPLPGAEPEVKVTPLGTVEMHVSAVPLETVLQLLSIESQRNIIASPDVTGTVTASLYNVTFEEALDAVLLANKAGYKIVDKFIFVYTNEELTRMEEEENPPITRVFPLSYIQGEDAQQYVTPLLGEGGTVAVSPQPDSGLGSGSEEGGGNAAANQDFIIVTARPEMIERVEAVLKEIDVRPKQVLIEATILRAELQDDNELGIDFSIVGGVDLELLGATSNGIQDLTLGPLPEDRLENFNAAAQTEFSNNVSPGGLSIGIIKDQVGIFIRALEAITDTTVLANPKVLALNKQKGQVIVGRRDGYLTTTVTETQSIQTVEFLETGTQLIFRPFIGNDGFVRVELHPEDSVGFVNAQGLPSEQTTEVTTNVIVEDGHTVLIGGLFREVSTDGRSQVPLIGNIPGIGKLFQSRVDSTAREEVIILLTIHIVKDHAKYARESMEQLENIERMRVGIRNGMMWHGRERLSRDYYRKALECYDKGDERMALWNLRLALHNDPRFLPAIELKDKLTGQRAWDDDGSGVRSFLRRLVAREHGAILPPHGRPAPPFTPPGELHGPNGFTDQE